MARVIDGRTLLWRLVSGAQEDPLLGGGHLGAGGRKALRLQPDCQPVQFHAELSEKKIKQVLSYSRKSLPIPKHRPIT